MTYTRDHKFVAHFKNEITRKLCGQIKKFFACEYSKNVHIKYKKNQVKRSIVPLVIKG